MDDDAAKKYLEVEYPKAIKFYDDRAKSSKLWYRIFSVYLIVVSAALTAMVALAPDSFCWRIFNVFLSATLGISAGLLSHLKSHENWLSYRATWDALERERRYFESGTGQYRSARDAGALFVTQIEAIRAREGDDFYARHRKVDEQTNPTDEKRVRKVGEKTSPTDEKRGKSKTRRQGK